MSDKAMNGRPSVSSRHPTAPSVMTVNGHFVPATADDASAQQYEHGIQVIDEDKEFR